jgi:5-methylcytosine-specific restriction protein A
MPLRPCLDCGRHIHGSRCPDHKRQRQRVKAARRPDQHTYREAQHRPQAVEAWRATDGDWCPGWGEQELHPAMDLTADHLWAVAAGGPEDGPLVVRCRCCNGARGAGAA